METIGALLRGSQGQPTWKMEPVQLVSNIVTALPGPGLGVRSETPG